MTAALAAIPSRSPFAISGSGTAISHRPAFNWASAAENGGPLSASGLHRSVSEVATSFPSTLRALPEARRKLDRSRNPRSLPPLSLLELTPYRQRQWDCMERCSPAQRKPSVFTRLASDAARRDRSTKHGAKSFGSQTNVLRLWCVYSRSAGCGRCGLSLMVAPDVGRCHELGRFRRRAQSNTAAEVDCSRPP